MQAHVVLFDRTNLFVLTAGVGSRQQERLVDILVASLHECVFFFRHCTPSVFLCVYLDFTKQHLTNALDLSHILSNFYIA